jgi:DmsE family decaheme c-type cytochrome
MRHLRGVARAVTVGGALLAALACVLASRGPASAEDPATAWSKDAVRARFPDPDAKATADDYAGSVECKECHEDRWKSLGTSFHAALRNEKKSGTHGCETCHGPGLVHVDEAGEAPIRHPHEAAPEVSVGACVTCHADVLEKPVLNHRQWIAGPAGAVRTCVTCHAVHVDKADKAFDDAVGPFADRKALAAVAEPVPAALCATCHTTFHPEMRRSGHAFLLTEGDQCAACHGNGSLHARSGGDPRKIVRPDRQRPQDADATCMGCHRDGDSVARWTCAEHAREKVACVVCHDANAPKGRTLRGTQFQLCGDCHRDVQAKVRLPNGHRVERGRVLCTDCHDPHGNTSKLRDKDLRTRVCGECHVEKTGPFLFDHGIKRTEGCVACHDPHGSANRRALTHATLRPLCLQCHPETPHDLAKPKYENCIDCHTEIHGSDLDRRFRR